MQKKSIIVFSTAAIIVFFDQLTKLLIRKNFLLNHSLPIIKDAFHITYVTNTGSAFGLFKSLNPILMLFSVAVIIAVFYCLKREVRENERYLQFSIGLLLGGTVGNLIDRLLYGHVIDFIDFRIWPVFNVADSAITISVIFLVILLWKK